MSVASPFLSDGCQNSTSHPTFVKTESSVMSGIHNQASTAFYLSSPVPFSPQCVHSSAERATSTSTSNSPVKELQNNRDQVIYEGRQVVTPEAGSNRASSTLCSPFDRTQASVMSQLDMTDTDKVGSVPDSSNSSICGLPCPCGMQFADSIVFVQHARHCVEFAQTAASFAEAAAAVACSSGPHTPSCCFTRHTCTRPNDASPNTVSSNKVRPKSPARYGETASENLEKRSGHQCALDLTVRPSSTAHDDGDHREPHERSENESGKNSSFVCSCGSIFDHLTSLANHRLDCPKKVTEFEKERITSDESGCYKGEMDWIPGTHAVAAPKQLVCTGCGEGGFTTPADLFVHFGSCTQMIPPITLPNSPLASHDVMKHAISPYLTSVSCTSTSTGSSPWKSCNPQDKLPTLAPPKLFGSPRFPLTCIPAGMSTSVMTRCSNFPPNYFHTGLPFSISVPHSAVQQSQVSVSATITTPKATHRSSVPKGTNGVEAKPFTNSKECSLDVNSGTTDLSRPFKCCHCIKAFKSKALLDQHMHIHYPPKYTCRYCAKKYRWPPVFYHHQRTCKKRPPAPPASSASTPNTNMDCSQLSIPMNTRNLSTKGLEMSVSGLHHVGIFSPSNNLHALTHASSFAEKKLNITSPSMALPANPFGPDFFLNASFQNGIHNFSAVDTVGIATLAAAATAAAVGLRFPFAPVPPPLGLPNTYPSMTAVSNSSSLGTLQNQRNLAPPPIVPTLPPFFNPPLNPAFLPHSSTSYAASNPTMNPPINTSSPQTTSYSGGSLFAGQTETALFKPAVQGLLCVCGTPFDEVPTYLTHLANCDVLHKLVGMNPLKKMSEAVTSSSYTHPTTCMQNQWRPEMCIQSKSGFMQYDTMFNSTVNCILDGTRGKTTGKEVVSTSPSTNLASTTAVRRMQHEYPRGQSVSPRFCTGRDTVGCSSGSTSQGWNDAKSEPFDFANQNIVEPKMEDFGDIFRSRSTGGTQLHHRSPGGYNPGSIDRSSPEMPYSTRSYGDVSNSPSSLMNAVAAALANATATTGLSCGSATEDASELQTPLDVTSSPLAFGAGSNITTAVKLCMQCGKEFSSRLSLKQHVEGKHSAEGKYQCPGCAKRYRWGASYYYHKKSCPAMQDQQSPGDTTAAQGLSGQEDESAAFMLFGAAPQYIQNGEYDMLMSTSPNVGNPFPIATKTGVIKSPTRNPSGCTVETMDTDELECDTEPAGHTYILNHGEFEHAVANSLNTEAL